MAPRKTDVFLQGSICFGPDIKRLVFFDCSKSKRNSRLRGFINKPLTIKTNSKEDEGDDNEGVSVSWSREDQS